MASWFETRAGQRERCREDALTMRVSDLIAKRCVSKDEAIELDIAFSRVNWPAARCASAGLVKPHETDHLRRLQLTGIAEFIIGRAFGRPVGSTHLTHARPHRLTVAQ